MALFACFFTDYAKVVMESILDASGLSNGKTAMIVGPLSWTCNFNKFPTVISVEGSMDGLHMGTYDGQKLTSEGKHLRWKPRNYFDNLV